MRTLKRLSLRMVVIGTAAAVAATTLVGPAQAGTESPETTGASQLPGSGPAVVKVEKLPDGDFEVTDMSTGETTIVDGDLINRAGAVPASEHHLIDGCGLDWGRPYCDLTRAAQGLLIVGSAAAVAAAICAASGTTLCIVASAAAAAAAWYLVEYGRCPGNLRVRLNYNGTFSVWCL